jgi:tetratricopeptide (TPR) repeat protein
MRKLLLAAVLVLPVSGGDWSQFRSGPYEIYTDAGARARETLLRLEQFRHALGTVLGETDLKTDIPIRVLLFEKERDRATNATPEPVRRGRDRYYIVLTARQDLKPDLKRALALLFLETNTARMPAAIERGLASLFSTLEIDQTRLTIGRPPAQPDKDWARMQLLTTSPEYYGKLRALLGNLRRGVPAGAAYRNTIGKTQADLEVEVERYFAAGKFEPAPLPGAAMSERDFYEKEVTPEAVRLALADLLLPSSRPSYEAMINEKTNVAEAYEGLGLISLSAGDRKRAHEMFGKAIEAGLQSPGAFVEFARLEPDDAKAVSAIQSALKLAPRLAEPHALRAEREPDPRKKMHWLKQATTNDPRKARYWEALAKAALDAKEFTEAGRAWRSAEQAAIEPADRDRYHQAWLAVEEQRLNWEAAERKREADEKEREIRALKEAALAEVRALEARANQGQADNKAPVVPWWDGPKAEGRAQGTLKQVDCLGARFRLVIQGADGKLTRLLIGNPGQVTVEGGGELALSCGVQQPPRRVVVQYHPKSDAKLATAGEVATIQFP